MINEVTVLIPTFNRSKLLNRALESISRQSKDINIHCVISDNLSTDNTQKVIQEWQDFKSNLKITYIKHKNSITPFENWKSLISHSDTEYSKFLFDDDWLESNALSTMLQDLSNLEAKSITYNTNIYAKSFNYEPIKNYYAKDTCELNMNIVIDSILKLSSPLPVTPSASILATDLLIKAMNFSEINKNCTKYPIGNDLIMNYYPTFLGKKSYFQNKSIVNLWGGNDSITIRTTDGKLLSFCYLESLIYLIDNFYTDLTKDQLKIINHKIFLNNFRSKYQKNLKAFYNSKTFQPSLSFAEIFKHFSSK